MSTDFQQAIATPTGAYGEGLRFFGGVGFVNNTLKRLAKDLEEREIAYMVIGAIALNQHGYQRFTQDIDLLMTPEGLERFHGELVGRGYRPAFEGARKKFRATAENVPIEVITAGEYPGDGRPKSIVFPDPTTVSVVIDGIRTVVQELIRIRCLLATLASELDESVRALYLELHHELELAHRAEEEGR